MITIKHEGCIFCVGCSSVCPKNAIEAVGTRMRHYPEKCIDCGICVKVCPANVITMHKGSVPSPVSGVQETVSSNETGNSKPKTTEEGD
jgi:formate hydrogenlyase subunit 6/NADH:ubiquinone oxidoreductase subunit I